MNVFVLCTGRCGSLTFARACAEMTNYTSAHESNSDSRRPRAIPYASLHYPANHVEVDNRLSWWLGRLEKEYGDGAYYVHLIRRQDEVARSLLRRWENVGTNIIFSYAWGHLKYTLDEVKALSDQERLEIGRHYWDAVNENIRFFLQNKSKQTTMWLHEIKAPFEEFWNTIEAQGDLNTALRMWDIRHNATD